MPVESVDVTCMYCGAPTTISRTVAQELWMTANGLLARRGEEPLGEHQVQVCHEYPTGAYRQRLPPDLRDLTCFQRWRYVEMFDVGTREYRRHIAEVKRHQAELRGKREEVAARGLE